MEYKFKVGQIVEWRWLSLKGRGTVVSVNSNEMDVPYEVQTESRIIANMFFAESELTAVE